MSGFDLNADHDISYPANDGCENDENKQWTETRASAQLDGANGRTDGRTERERAHENINEIIALGVLNIVVLRCAKPVVSPSKHVLFIQYNRRK